MSELKTIETLPENKATVDPVLTTPIPETRGAFDAYLRGRPFDTRALAVGTGGAGGYVAPEGFEAELIRALNEQSVMRRIARVLPPITQASVRIPKNLTGVAAAWVGENQAITPSDPTFGQVEFTPHKIGALTLVSNELLADSAVNVEQLLATLFGEAFAALEDAAFFAGDGNGKPSGILNEGSIEAVITAAANAVSTDEILALYDALPPQYRATAVWVMNPATMSHLRKLKDNTGRYLLVEGLAGAAPTTLLGRPVYLSSNMPAIAPDAKVIVFGDVARAYLIVDRQGIEVQRSSDRYFESDQTAFRAIARTDGKVVLPDAVRFLKMAAA
jgi:HK97 family phage major capsid protein